MADIHHCSSCGGELCDHGHSWYCHYCGASWSHAQIITSEEPPEYQHPDGDPQ